MTMVTLRCGMCSKEWTRAEPNHRSRNDYTALTVCAKCISKIYNNDIFFNESGVI